MSPKPAERFLSSLGGYYNTDAFSDMAIVCDGQEFKVHRVIIAAHSTYFAALLNGPWKENTEKQIQITDFDPSVVEGMIRFIYFFDYTNTHGVSTMVYNAQIYQIADKYIISALKEHATAKFAVAIDEDWMLNDFLVAVAIVYESTPLNDRGLRDLVVDTFCKHIDTLVDRDSFDELLRKTPDFAADLVPSLYGKRYACHLCGYVIRDSIDRFWACPNCGTGRLDGPSRKEDDGW